MGKKRKVTINSLQAKIKRLEMETRSTPKWGPAKRDPNPVSASKTQYIDRTVQVFKEASGGTVNITVDDIKAQSSSAGFKILALSAWVLGAQSATFTLGSDTWAGSTSTAQAYVDTAPADRLCGARVNIPDTLSKPMNTGSDIVVSASLAGTYTGVRLVVEPTIRYQL